MSIETSNSVQAVEHEKRINLGERAKNFLNSDEWKTLVKPIIDSMIKGLVDIRNLKSADMDSEKKAGIEVKARRMASEYLGQVETFLEEYLVDASESKKQVERHLRANNLYKTTD